MRQLLFAFIFLFTISIVSCSDNGTGPNNEETTTYSVAVDVTPSEAGSISPSSEDTYDEGEEVELQADANEEYLFTHWSGDIDSTSDNPLSLTVDQDYNLTANFELKTYELSINTEGEGSVNEEVLEQKSKDYEHGTVVELTANPSEGYKFVEWQGDVTGSQNPVQITVDAPKEVTAVFKKRSFSLTLSAEGEGSISKTPNQLEYNFGSTVQLKADPSNGWSFKKWSRDFSGSENPVEITIDSTIKISAIFENDSFAGGNGTEANPYQVSTIDQLQEIANYTDAHVVLINDIDASATANWNNSKGFEPIGPDYSKGFTGVFNGQGYTIKNLTINRTSDNYVGLFGYISNAIVKNVSIESSNITGDRYVGSFIGRSDNDSKVKDLVYSSGNIEGYRDVGGLIGMNDSILDSSSSAGNVSGEINVGGLVGSGNHLGEINNSSSTGTITGTNYATGGLIGRNDNTINNSFATGTVSGNNSVGGLIGFCDGLGKVYSSYATGDISGNNNIGGFVGEVADNGKINYAYSTGQVEGQERIGGFVGKNDGEITQSYSIGNVTGSIDTGGYVGLNSSGSISTSFWNTETSNQDKGAGRRGTIEGLSGLSTFEMTGNTVTETMSSFDFEQNWVITTDYPKLSWE